MRLEPDLAMLPFDDSLRNRQTEPFALSLLWVETMEKIEDLWLMLSGDADTVVLHRVDGSAILNPALDSNLAGSRGVAVFEGIVEEIGKDLSDKCRIAETDGQRSDFYGGEGFLRLELE